MSSIYRPITQIISGIARDRLGIETLASRGSDSLDFHDLSVMNVGQALGDAYEAGYRAAIAEELGVTEVVYSHDAERFPWQVFCTEERCVLVSRDLKDHSSSPQSSTPTTGRTESTSRGSGLSCSKWSAASCMEPAGERPSSA